MVVRGKWFQYCAVVASLVWGLAVTAQARQHLDVQNLTSAIEAQSCSRPDSQNSWNPIKLTVFPVSLYDRPPDGNASLPPHIKYVGGWNLRSDERHFGGLSGLAILGDGTLLAISDTGRFVRINTEGGVPTGEAAIVGMRFENRRVRPGKLTADAEGLHYENGLALVSMERTFRVLAFALGACPDHMFGVEIAEPPRRINDRKVPANAGPEALWRTKGGQIRVGYEHPQNGMAIVGDISETGTVTLSALEQTKLTSGFRLVGGDYLKLENGSGVTATLFRAYDRKRGNRNELHIQHDDKAAFIIHLDPPMTMDNFEAIALSETQDGIRAYILSDDNFSDRQKTLLFAFDIDHPPMDKSE